MQSEQRSNPSSKKPGWRSKTVGVEVVYNRSGWFVNVSLNKVPYKSLGPFEGEMTLPRALQFIATTLTLEGEI